MSSLFDRSEVMTWPNAVTFVRLLCIPVFVLLLFEFDRRLSAAVLLAVLGSTDWVDGWIARRYNAVSRFGAIFDPTVDRLLFFVVVPCLIWDGSLALAIAVLTFGREACVALLALAYTGLTRKRFEVTMEGKTGTFLLMIAFPLFLAANAENNAAPVFEWLAWFCVAPGLLFSWYSALGQYGASVYRHAMA